MPLESTSEVADFDLHLLFFVKVAFLGNTFRPPHFINNILIQSNWQQLRIIELLIEWKEKHSTPLKIGCTNKTYSSFLTLT